MAEEKKQKLQLFAGLGCLFVWLGGLLYVIGDEVLHGQEYEDRRRESCYALPDQVSAPNCLDADPAIGALLFAFVIFSCLFGGISYLIGRKLPPSLAIAFFALLILTSVLYALGSTIDAILEAATEFGGMFVFFTLPALAGLLLGMHFRSRRLVRPSN